MSSVIQQAVQQYKNGNHTKVIHLCKQILAKKLDFPALKLMGLALHKKNMLRDSLAMFEYAEKLQPKNIELQLDKVDTLMRLAESADYSSFLKAALILRKITREDPHNFRAHKQLKEIYMKLFFNRSAERLMLKFMKNNPDSAEIRYDYYSFLIMLGRFDEAKNILNEAISMNPVYALDFTWDRVNKGYDPDARIEQLIKVDETVAVNDFFKAFYYMSRGQAHQKRKEFDQAFKYFSKANKKYRPTVIYDVKRFINHFNYLVRAFTKENYERLRSFSDKFTEPDVVPVFIVGLPRSGSTLIESILCAHDEVEGVGEINDFKENMVTVLSDYKENIHAYCYRVDNISEEQLLALRDRYLKLLKSKNARINGYQGENSKTKYLVNKMLTNYQYVPLIKAAFPNAKIIHARRHAVDTCWSSFKMFFNGDDNYIYNLKELATHYNMYRELMDEWDKVLGDDLINVDHEKLTANPQEEISRLLEYCDLDWSDKCLNFHKEVKTVKTASFEQVRNPITHKERMAWEDYEPFLGDLIDNINPEYL